MRRLHAAYFELAALGSAALVPPLLIAAGTLLQIVQIRLDNSAEYYFSLHMVCQSLCITLAAWWPVCTTAFLRETPGCCLYYTSPVSIFYWGIWRTIRWWLLHCALMALSVSATCALTELGWERAGWLLLQMCVGSLCVAALGFASAAWTRSMLNGLLIALAYAFFIMLMNPRPNVLNAYWLESEFPNRSDVAAVLRRTLPGSLLLLVAGHAGLLLLPPKSDYDV